MASLGGCALEDDEVASKPSALEYHRLSPRRRKGSRSAKRIIILCIREEEGSKSVFLFWITVSSLEYLRLCIICDVTCVSFTCLTRDSVGKKRDFNDE